MSSGLFRAARSSFTAEQCAENVAAVVEGALQHIPRKWSNVQALYLRTAESAALPIYQVNPSAPELARHAGGKVNPRNCSRITVCPNIPSNFMCSSCGRTYVESAPFFVPGAVYRLMQHALATLDFWLCCRSCQSSQCGYLWLAVGHQLCLLLRQWRAHSQECLRLLAEKVQGSCPLTLQKVIHKLQGTGRVVKDLP